MKKKTLVQKCDLPWDKFLKNMFLVLRTKKMKTIIECCVSASATRVCGLLPYRNYSCNSMLATCSASSSTTRRTLSLSLISTTFSAFIFSLSPPSSSSSSSSKLPLSKFFEIPDSGGVKALDLLDGSGEVPSDGDQVFSPFHLYNTNTTQSFIFAIHILI